MSHKLAQRLSDLLGVEVADHPFDLGYWSRIANRPRPRAEQQARGWDRADRELQAEKEGEG